MSKVLSFGKNQIKICFFSHLIVPLHRFYASLSNGVMVAQQVLVLFVVVRIRLGQRFRT